MVIRKYIWRFIDDVRVDRAVRTWLRDTYSRVGVMCYTKLSTITYCRLIHSSRHTDEPCSDRDMQVVGAIVCVSGGFEEACEDMGVWNDEGPSINWLPVFRSPSVEVWIRQKESDPQLPLLTKKEGEMILVYARSILARGVSDSVDYSRSLPEGEIYTKLSSPSFAWSAADVVLWVRGELRGSQIRKGESILSAVLKATEASLLDPRFRPLTSDERDAVRIEIHLLSGLRIPLAHEEREAGLFYTDKTYTLTDGVHEGTFVPSVFNCRSFASLGEFLFVLWAEKLGGKVRQNSTHVYLEETHSWVEEEKKGSIGVLRGTHTVPVLLPGTMEDDMERIVRGVDFLRRAQYGDGSFRTVCSPFEENDSRIDWVRNAHIVSALGYVRTVLPSGEEKQGVHDMFVRGYDFLIRELRGSRVLPLPVTCGALLYVAESAHHSGDGEVLTELDKEIQILAPRCVYDPILYTNLHLHYERMKRIHKEKGGGSSRWGEQVIRDLMDKKRKGSPIHLASYFGLFAAHIYQNEIFEGTATWLLSHQQEDGSFPQSTEGGVSTTRGVSKMLETLARRGMSRHDPVFMCTLEWLELLQYHEKMPRFVREARQGKFLWGFRDNAQSPIVRSDSVSHYLIALSLCPRSY